MLEIPSVSAGLMIDEAAIKEAVNNAVKKVLVLNLVIYSAFPKTSFIIGKAPGSVKYAKILRKCVTSAKHV